MDQIKQSWMTFSNSIEPFDPDFLAQQEGMISPFRFSKDEYQGGFTSYTAHANELAILSDDDWGRKMVEERKFQPEVEVNINDAEGDG